MRSGKPVIAGVLAALAVSTSAWAQAAGQWRDGEHLYAQICQYCHETGVGPKLWGRELAADYVIATARQGRAGMPAFRFTEIDEATLRKLGEIVASGRSLSPSDAGRKE